jgi:hypothetical protein
MECNSISLLTQNDYQCIKKSITINHFSNSVITSSELGSNASRGETVSRPCLYYSTCLTGLLHRPRVTRT